MHINHIKQLISNNASLEDVINEYYTYLNYFDKYDKNYLLEDSLSYDKKYIPFLNILLNDIFYNYSEFNNKVFIKAIDENKTDWLDNFQKKFVSFVKLNPNHSDIFILYECFNENIIHQKNVQHIPCIKNLLSACPNSKRFRLHLIYANQIHSEQFDEFMFFEKNFSEYFSRNIYFDCLKYTLSTSNLSIADYLLSKVGLITEIDEFNDLSSWIGTGGNIDAFHYLEKNICKGDLKQSDIQSMLEGAITSEKIDFIEDLYSKGYSIYPKDINSPNFYKDSFFLTRKWTWGNLGDVNPDIIKDYFFILYKYKKSDSDNLFEEITYLSDLSEMHGVLNPVVEELKNIKDKLDLHDTISKELHSDLNIKRRKI